MDRNERSIVSSGILTCAVALILATCWSHAEEAPASTPDLSTQIPPSQPESVAEASPLLEGYRPLGPPTLEDLEKLQAAPRNFSEPPRKRRKENERQDASAADPLTQMMQSADPLIRIRAVEGISAERDGDSAAMLLVALSDADPGVSEAARRAIDHAEPTALVDSVIGVLGWGDPGVAEAVDAALPALRSALDAPLTAVFTAKDAPRIKRMAAAYCLGRIGSRQAGDALANEVWGDDLALAFYCADAMISLDDPGLLRQLTRMAEHPQVRMRVAAYQALARIGGDDVRHILTEAAAGRTEQDTSARKIAIRMLAYVGNAETVDFLIGLVRAQNALVRPATDALATMTGLPHGLERERWLEWYDEVYTPQKQAFENRAEATKEKVDKKNVPIGFPAEGFPFKP